MMSDAQVRGWRGADGSSLSGGQRAQSPGNPLVTLGQILVKSEENLASFFSI